MTGDRTFIAAEVVAYEDAAQDEGMSPNHLYAPPDDLWAEIHHLLPPEKPPGTRGRPVVPFRRVTDGILYVLRTGCQLKALPREYGSGSTCHRRFQAWVKADVFERVGISLTFDTAEKWYPSTGHIRHDARWSSGPGRGTIGSANCSSASRSVSRITWGWCTSHVVSSSTD